MYNITNTKQRFFIGITPPKEICTHVFNIKRWFYEEYKSEAALKSPTHIKLVSPFECDEQDIIHLEEALLKFVQTQKSVLITTDNFGAFPPKVIFINIIKTVGLLNLIDNLNNHLYVTVNKTGIGGIPTHPHINVAFKDLTEDNFTLAWENFKKYEYAHEFHATKLTLFIFKEDKWEIDSEFNFFDAINYPETEV